MTDTENRFNKPLEINYKIGDLVCSHGYGLGTVYQITGFFEDWINDPAITYPAMYLKTVAPKIHFNECKIFERKHIANNYIFPLTKEETETLISQYRETLSTLETHLEKINNEDK